MKLVCISHAKRKHEVWWRASILIESDGNADAIVCNLSVAHIVYRTLCALVIHILKYYSGIVSTVASLAQDTGHLSILFASQLLIVGMHH